MWGGVGAGGDPSAESAFQDGYCCGRQWWGAGWGRCHTSSLTLHTDTDTDTHTHTHTRRPGAQPVFVSVDRVSGACDPAALCPGGPCEQVDGGMQGAQLAPCLMLRLTKPAPLPLQASVLGAAALFGRSGLF